MLINPSFYVPFTATLSLQEVGVEWAAWARVTAFLFYRQRWDEKRSRREWELRAVSEEQGAVTSWGLQDEGRESHVSHGWGVGSEL